jgi:recombination protein RecT
MIPVSTVPVPATKPDKVPAFLAMLEQAKGEIARVLPEHVKPERVMRVARTAWQMDAKLQQCSARSILSSVMKACELGLEPSGALKHCYLVPFKGEATLILGYAGLLELARRSGQYLKIESRIVNERDVFLLEYNPDPLFRHQPCLEGDAGLEKLVYAYARLKGGELAFEIMTRDQVEAIRKRLPEFQRSSPAWRDYWGEMARKVVLKRLLKRLPLSVELASAVADDNDDDERILAVHPTADEPARPTLSRADAIAEKLGALPAPEEITMPAVEPEVFPTDRPAATEEDFPTEEREPGSDDA